MRKTSTPLGHPRFHSPSRGGSAVGIVIALALLGVVFFYAWRTSSGGEEAADALTLDERYALDHRLQPLIADCAYGATFDPDTTHLAEVLASKLDAGAQLEPLRRARTDLAAMGDAAAEPLMRLFQDASRDKYRTGVAKNVLIVCSLTESDWGVPIALEALRAAAPDLRSDGAIVLKRHPSPDHYEALSAVLPGFRLPVNVERCLQAMHACDPLRFAREVPQWVEDAEPDEGYITSSMVDAVLPLVASVDDEEIADAYLEVARTARGLLLRHVAYLLAPAVRQGDEVALRNLTDMLMDESPQPRHHATQALVCAGRSLETYVLAATSQIPSERAATLQAILDNPRSEERTQEQEAEVVQWARIALGDEAPEVREVALAGLLARGDDEGFTALMNLVGGTIFERGIAMRSMRDRLDGQPGWADQVRSVLIALWEQEAHTSQRPAELTSILATLGAVPGESTGRFILETADIIGNNPVHGMRGFHWAIGQAFNAGPEARDVLRERFLEETDPFNRLDLISFLWQDFTLESADALLAVIDDEGRSPYERLYAAGCVVRMGRSEHALPVLKRVYRSTNDPVLRPGLHCLLWVWFGPPLG